MRWCYGRRLAAAALIPLWNDLHYHSLSSLSIETKKTLSLHWDGWPWGWGWCRLGWRWRQPRPQQCITPKMSIIWWRWLFMISADKNKNSGYNLCQYVLAAINILRCFYFNQTLAEHHSSAKVAPHQMAIIANSLPNECRLFHNILYKSASLALNPFLSR